MASFDITQVPRDPNEAVYFLMDCLIYKKTPKNAIDEIDHNGLYECLAALKHILKKTSLSKTQRDTVQRISFADITNNNTTPIRII